MRRVFSPPLAYAVACLAGAAGFFAACSSDDAGGVHGPTFGDGGDDSSTVADGAPGDDGASTGDGASGDDGSTGGDAGPDAPGCTQGSIAVVGATGASRFASIATGSGAFTTQTLAGSTFGSAVAVAAFGTGYVAVGRGAPLAGATDMATTWSSFASVGIGTGDQPALAVVGTKLHLVYLASSSDAGVDHKLFHGTFTTSWDSADDPVVSGATQDFAPRAPSAAGIGSELLVAEAGDDGNLYAHSWSGSWGTVVPVGAPADKDVIPHVVALEGAASSDAMIVYVRRVVSGGQDFKITSVVRSTGGTWGSPTPVNDTAYTTDGLSALALSSGRVLLAWRGVDDAKPYFSIWSGTAWSAPAPFFAGGQPTLNAKPELARGICGDDAVAVYPEAGAGAKVTRLRGTTWGAPTALPSASGATDVGIATRP